MAANHLLGRTLVALVVVASVAQLAIDEIHAAKQTAPEKVAKRHNIMDPIYAFDDIELHAPGYQQVNPTSITTTSKKPPATAPSSRKPVIASQVQSNQRRSINATTSTTQTPAEKNKDLIDEDERPAHLRPTTTTTAAPRLLIGSVNRVGAGSGGSLSQAEFLEALLNQNNGPSVSNSSVGGSAVAKKKQENEQPATHWSALNNYYEKLRQQSLLRQQQQPLPMFPPTQQVQETDDSLFGAKGAAYHLSQQQQRPQVTPLWTNQHQPSTGYHHASQAQQLPGKSSPFLLDLGGNHNQQQQAAISEPDYSQLFSSAGRGGGGGSSAIGDGSILLRQKAAQTQEQLEWRKLPELLYLQQQQKAKSQQSQICSWYDRQINEILRAMSENGCGRVAAKS